MAEFWYRYDAIQVSTDFYDVGPGRTEILCTPFRVQRTTAKGVWLMGIGNKAGGKFVLRDARKRWACPTQEEALVSFVARKRRQFAILNAQSKIVASAILLALGEQGREKRLAQKKPAPAIAGTGGWGEIS